MSWSAVIKFHGPAPVPAVNRIWVANHSSMIDYGILCSYRPFAVIMQVSRGGVGCTKCGNVPFSSEGQRAAGHLSSLS